MFKILKFIQVSSAVKLAICMWFSFVTSDLFSQSSKEPIRLVFDQVAFYDPLKEEWGEWQESRNIFIFRHNVHDDVLVYQSNGESQTLIKRTDWDKVEKSDTEYVIADFINEQGDLLSLQVYTKPRVFLKMIFKNGLLIQFEQK